MPKNNKKHFASNKNGFHITFDNGLTLSTQFGYCTYCENHDKPNEPDYQKRFDTSYESDNAEIAILDKDGELITQKLFPEEGESVIGYVNFTRWLEIFKTVRDYK